MTEPLPYRYLLQVRLKSYWNGNWRKLSTIDKAKRAREISEKTLTALRVL